MNQAEQIGELLLRHTCNELTPEEEAELLAWRHVSPKNERLFREETDPVQLASEIKLMLDSKELIFKRIMARGPFPIPAAEIKHHRIHKALRIAAMFLVVIGAGLYVLLRGGPNSKPGSNEAVFIDADGIATALDDMHRGALAGYAGIRFERDENGELIYIASNRPNAAKDEYFKLYTRTGKLSLRLPDSSMVWLNSMSSIRYPANFSGDTVRIFIEGEAYFEPAKSRKPALRIMVRRMYIDAEAGSFNIHAYPNSLTSLTLLDGTLRMGQDTKPGSAPSEVLLEPGQQARLVRDSLHILKNVDVDTVMAWRDNKSPGIRK